MFDEFPSPDGEKIFEKKSPPSQQDQTNQSGWNAIWERISKFGLSDIALRVGSAMMTIGLVGLVVWVMRGNFVDEEIANASPEPAAFAAGGQNGQPLELPAFEGVSEVEGLSKSADSHTSAPVAAASRTAFTEYAVVEGDTIYGIAESFGLDPETLLWTNYEILRDNPAAIYPGQVLKIPPVDGVLYTWHEGDGLNGVANGLNVTTEDILSWEGNNLTVESVGDFANPNIEPGTVLFAPGGSRYFYDWTMSILAREEPAESAIWGDGRCAPATTGPIGTGTYIWPTTEHYLSGYDFSPAINHYGVDLGGDLGNPLYAVDNGVIVYAGWNDWGYGNVVAIDHGNGYQTLYAHLDSLNVGCGSFVTQGDVIGYMGNTGNSSGPHLHFEIIGESYGRQNPRHYLPF